MTVLQRIEAFYDAVPRVSARAERVGPLTLFVREGVGWPYYARPGAQAGPITADDVAAVRRRQVELGVPQALEWVEELAPTLAGAAQRAGLVVRHCPLLVLSGAPVAPDVAAGVRVLRGDEPDLAVLEAVAHV
ncbi:MAG: GNAT family N-acetyltransferase, partial [Actinomycetota bacterium]